MKFLLDHFEETIYDPAVFDLSDLLTRTYEDAVLKIATSEKGLFKQTHAKTMNNRLPFHGKIRKVG